MKGDNDSWDRNTSNGRKRSYCHIREYGLDEPKYIQLELNLGLEPVPPRFPVRDIFVRSRERKYFFPQNGSSVLVENGDRTHTS